MKSAEREAGRSGEGSFADAAATSNIPGTRSAMNAIPAPIEEDALDELIRLAVAKTFAPRDNGPRYAIAAFCAKVTSQGVHYGEIAAR